MMLHITKYNQIYLSTQLSPINVSLIIKRNVGGEVAKIVPKNMSSFSHQVLTLTGRGGPLLMRNGGIPVRQGTVLCSRPFYPTFPFIQKSHPRTDFTISEKNRALAEEANQVLQKKPSTQVESEIVPEKKTVKVAPSLDLRPPSVLPLLTPLPLYLPILQPQVENSSTSTNNHKESDSTLITQQGTSEDPKLDIITEDTVLEQVSQSPVNQITLINSKNETYTTSITEQSTSDQFTSEMLIDEGIKRGLIKVDNDKTEVKILLKDGTSAIIGSSKNNVKLTPLGQAYDENLPKSTDTIYEQTSPCPETEDTKLIISVPPKSTDNTIINSGKQKHLILAEDKENADYVIAIGYLTSKKTGTHLTDKQFKAFQNEKAGVVITQTKTHEKTQGVKLFEVPLRLKKDDIKEVAWDKEYLADIPRDKFTLFLKEVKTRWVKGFKDFSSEALTKEEILQMCKNHDSVVKKNGKHPLTAEQIKQNIESQLKQQEKVKLKQQEKAKNKLKQTLNNTENPDKL